MYFSYKINWRTHIICLIIAGAVAFILRDLVTDIIDILLQQDFIYNYPSKYIILNFYIYLILLMIPIVIVHEGIHA
ncbi:MAG: hypothetical protein K0R54_5473, partial [Clostridiaceae bacterium]|nr:hypothetical protein [Clostridiaceae bacterium]